MLTMYTMRESEGVALIILTYDDGLQTWHVCGVDHERGQVYSLPADSPREGGQWIARINPAGVRYVSRPRKRATAERYWRRIVAEYKSLRYE